MIKFSPPIQMIHFTKKYGTIKGGNIRKSESFLIKNIDLIKKEDYSFLDNEDPFKKRRNHRKAIDGLQDLYDYCKTEGLVFEDFIEKLIPRVLIDRYKYFLWIINFLLECGLQKYLNNSESEKNLELILKNEKNQDKKEFLSKNFKILTNSHPKQELNIRKFSSLKEIDEYVSNLGLRSKLCIRKRVEAEFLITYSLLELEEAFREDYYKEVEEIIGTDGELSIRFINSKLGELSKVDNNERTLELRRELFEPIWGDPFSKKTLWFKEEIDKKLLDWYKKVIISDNLREFFSEDTNPDRIDFWKYVVDCRAITNIPVNLPMAKAFLLKLNVEYSSKAKAFLSKFDINHPANQDLYYYVVEFRKTGGRAYFFYGPEFDKIIKRIYEWENESDSFFKPLTARGEKKGYMELSKPVLFAEVHRVNEPIYRKWSFSWQDAFEDRLVDMGIL